MERGRACQPLLLPVACEHVSLWAVSVSGFIQKRDGPHAHTVEYCILTGTLVFLH